MPNQFIAFMTIRKNSREISIKTNFMEFNENDLIPKNQIDQAIEKTGCP
jgi:hypothetical protein